MNSNYKLGSVCAVLIAIIYLVTSLIFLFLPEAQQNGDKNIEDFFFSVAQNAFLIKLFLGGFIISSILGIAVVISLDNVLSQKNGDWIHWASALAIIGFATIIVSDLQQLKNIPHMANAFVDSSLPNRSILKTIGIGFNDSVVFGLIGLWMMIINGFAMRNHQFNKGLSLTGIAAGLAYFLITIGYLFAMEILNMIVAILGGLILGPVWYFWIGRFLNKVSANN